MKTFYKSLLFGVFVAILKYLFWKLNLEFWEISLISISGLVAGIFFILASIFQSALRDYKEADESVCKIQGSVCSMNDVNLSAEINAPGRYKSEYLSKELIKTLQIIKAYIEDKKDFFKLQKNLNQLIKKAAPLEKVSTPDKGAIFFNYLNQLRSEVSYLEYGKSLRFPKVGYDFLYFFIFCLIFLQIFNETVDLSLEIIFIFSLSTVLVFFAGLISDLDRPFIRNRASFRVDLSPLEVGIKSIKKNLKS